MTRSEYLKLWRQKNREKIKVYKKQNKERIKNRDKGYYQKNKAKKALQKKRWLKENYEYKLAYNRELRKKNPEPFKASAKRSRQRHKLAYKIRKALGKEAFLKFRRNETPEQKAMYAVSYA